MPFTQRSAINAKPAIRSSVKLGESASARAAGPVRHPRVTVSDRLDM